MLLDSNIVRISTLIACGSLFVICDVLAANWGKNGSTPSLIGAIFLAPLSYVLFGYLNQKYALAVASAWVVLILCISTVLIGVFYFKDPLTARQIVGLLLAIIAITLLVF